jgi:lipopolysaccharide/colanic/teichoic acid biosynthesis glycosyltransferase
MSSCFSPRRHGGPEKMAGSIRVASAPPCLRASVVKPPEAGLPRAFELFIAALGCALLWPLLALLALFVRLESPGSPLFRQIRVGRGGRPFTLYKLRSMRADAATCDLSVSDLNTFLFTPARDPRRTRLGAVLRATSLDEAPQLLNVVRGDMAIVGPRPEVPEIVAQYPPAYHARHAVRPGLTGLAQIHGRADLTVGATLAHDLAYVRARSPRLDVTILLRTAAVVLRRTGAR